MIKAFNNSLETLRYLQGKFGSADYKDWQYLRTQFYSYVNYPEAGQSTLTFFGSALGGSLTLEDTNMPKAGSFGQVHFLIKSIRVGLRINTNNLDAWNGDDDSTLFSDYLAGFVQAGVLSLEIGARSFLEIPLPLLYSPSGKGVQQRYSAGIDLLTLAEGAPNTLSAFRSSAPFATTNGRGRNTYVVDPQILVEAEQNFSATLSFPSGLVPVIGTDITDDTTNPLKVGISLDGIQFRPVQ